MNRKTAPLGPLGDADIRLLRVFRAVVAAGGFTAAMPALGVSRSAISLHMAELEARVGMKLCQRGRSGFALTEEGRSVHAAALRLLAALEGFRTEVNDLYRTLRGELNIGITDTLVSLPHMRISNALAALKARGPEVRINIHMMPPGEIESGVMDGHLHVGVVPVTRALGALRYRRLYGETAYLYCAAGHPLAQSPMDAAAIARADAVMPAYALPEAGQARHAALKATATATDREGIAFLVLTGRYVGYLPEHFACRWETTGELRRLDSRRLRYRIDYAVITPRGRRASRVLETFMGALEDVSDRPQ